MIESIGIKNYKSIVDLQFDVGRVNVLIGENGSGKSNILEAIALAAAAEADKLDNEFLTSRGIRVTSPLLMLSNFNQPLNGPIEISISIDAEEKKRITWKMIINLTQSGFVSKHNHHQKIKVKEVKKFRK